jgi:hypothetical protein
MTRFANWKHFNRFCWRKKIEIKIIIRRLWKSWSIINSVIYQCSALRSPGSIGCFSLRLLRSVLFSEVDIFSFLSIQQYCLHQREGIFLFWRASFNSVDEASFNLVDHHWVKNIIALYYFERLSNSLRKVQIRNQKVLLHKKETL